MLGLLVSGEFHLAIAFEDFFIFDDLSLEVGVVDAVVVIVELGVIEDIFDLF